MVFPDKNSIGAMNIAISEQKPVIKLSFSSLDHKAYKEATNAGT
jgi:hypothetical protein